MRKTIACLTAMSLLVMIAPSALALHSSHVAVKACGAYNYNGTQGADTVGVEVNPYYRVVHEPNPEEFEKGANAFAEDVQDGDAEADNDSAVWDLGPDPIDGNGYVHVSLIEGFEETVGVGSDTLDDQWSTRCD